jgi:hypothetical protein
MKPHLALGIAHSIFFAICMACGGCGMMRQSLSPDLGALAHEYGVVTIPNQDQKIIFQNKPIDDAEFARAFKHLKAYGGVKELVLNGQEISDASLPLIIQLQQLEILHLQGTKVSLDGLRQLSSLPHLRGIFVEAERFTLPQLAQLRQSLPNVEVAETWYILDYGWRKPTTRPTTAPVATGI